MDLARNSEKHTSHGWFVVRNSTPLEAQSSLEPLERQWIEESFFRDLPWNALPEHRRGTQALKEYLADLLCSRIKENFPLMLSTIRSRIKNTQSRLETLGSTRETIDQKRIYLTKLSQDFHLAASQALRGRYEPSTADSVKLRRLVREANDAFAKEMKEYGHTVPFLEIPNVQEGVKKSNQQVKNSIFMTSTPNDTNVGNGKEEFPRFVERDQSGVRLYQDYYSAEEIRLNKYEKSSKSSDPSKEKSSSPGIPNKAPPLAPNPSGNQSTSSPLGLFGQNFGGNQSAPSPLGLFSQNLGGNQSTPSPNSLFGQTPSGNHIQPNPFSLLNQTPSGNHIQPSPFSLLNQTPSGNHIQPSPFGVFGQNSKGHQTQPSGPNNFRFGKTPETNQTQPSGPSGVGSSISVKAPENHQTKPSGPSGFGSIGPGSSIFTKAVENHQRQSAAAGEHANSRSAGNGESSSGNLFKTERKF